MRSLDDPTTCPIAWDFLSLGLVHATCRDVSCVTVFGHQFANVGIIVAFVLTYILRFFLGRLRSLYRNTLDRFTHQAFVMNIRATYCHAQGYAGTVRQERSFGAEFGPIRGIFACFFTPQRSFGHGGIHGLPVPLNSLEFVVFVEGYASHLPEKTSLGPALKIAMQRTARAKLGWCCFPLAAGPKDVE